MLVLVRGIEPEELRAPLHGTEHRRACVGVTLRDARAHAADDGVDLLELEVDLELGEFAPGLGHEPELRDERLVGGGPRDPELRGDLLEGEPRAPELEDRLAPHGRRGAALGVLTPVGRRATHHAPAAAAPAAQRPKSPMSTT